MRAPVQIPLTPAPHSVLNEGSFICLHNEIVSSDVILQVRIRHANLKTCLHQYNQLDAALTGSQTSSLSLLFSFLLNMTVAAAAAKSLQSCPTLCDPIDGNPPGSAVPGILQARTLEWVAISFSNGCK